MKHLFFYAALSCLVGCEDCASKPAASDAATETKDAAVVNTTVLPAASVMKLVNPAGNPPYTGETGSVEGTIRVDGDPALKTPADFSRCPDAEKTWGTSFREGKNRALADAIVGITGYKGVFVPETREAKEITIEGCAYTARTAILTLGQRLDVKNKAKEFWTPVLEPSTSTAVMMATPGGDAVKIYPKKLGQHFLIDRDRKYAVVDLYTLRDPLHAVSDLDGHYRIDGIPVGKMTVNVLHPRIDGEASAEVEIKPGLVQTIDLVLTHHHKDAGPATLGDGAAPASTLR